jgi:hypothetical protein
MNCMGISCESCPIKETTGEERGEGEEKGEVSVWDDRMKKFVFHFGN